MNVLQSKNYTGFVAKLKLPSQILQVTKAEIVNFVDANVDNDYQRIRGDVFFVEKVPRSAMGKLLRRKAKDFLLH